MPKTEHSDAVYPIRVVAEQTGINPVTLRAWERRYGLIKPHRTAKGHRLYSARDITAVQHILALLDQGIPISRVQDMLDTAPPPAQPPHGAEPAHDPTGPGERWDRWVQQMATAVTRFDQRTLDLALSDALSLHPEARVHRLVLEPLLDRLEHRWRDFAHADAERHFAHSALSHRLAARLLQLARQPGQPGLVLAGLAGEPFETRTLLLALALRAQGIDVIYLGAGCQAEALGHALTRSEAAALVLYSELLQPARLLDGALNGLARHAAVPVFMAGAGASEQAGELRAAGIIALPRDCASAVQQIGERLA